MMIEDKQNNDEPDEEILMNFKKVMDEEGPVVLEVVRSLNIEPS